MCSIYLWSIAQRAFEQIESLKQLEDSWVVYWEWHLVNITLEYQKMLEIYMEEEL